MLGVDELKTKRAPHEDLRRVLVHVAGIYAKKSNRCAGQEEKQEKANAPPQAFDALHRWTPVNSVDIRCAHAAAPHAPSIGRAGSRDLLSAARFSKSHPQEEDRTKAGH